MKTGTRYFCGGFSMVDLLLIVATMVGMVLIILPALTRPHVHVWRTTCVSNLKQISIASRSWALDSNDGSPMHLSITNGGAVEWSEQGSAYAAFSVMSNDLVTPKILYCPEDIKRGRAPANVFVPTTLHYAGYVEVVFSPTNLSYFVGIDADDIYPDRIYAGDDHFQVAGRTPPSGLLLLPTNPPVAWRNERHPKQGNIAFADGSVRTVNTAEFRAALGSAGIATNRLAMP